MPRNKQTRDLEAFHREGKDAIAKYGKRWQDRRKVYGALADLSMAERNRIHVARQFADLYDDKALKKLIQLGMKHRRPFTVRLITELIRVEDGKERRRLAKECAEQGWSSLQLRREAQKIMPARLHSGKPPKAVKDTLASQVVLTEEVLRKLLLWVNWLRKEQKVNSPAICRQRKIWAKLEQIATLAEELEQLCTAKKRELIKRPRKKGR